MFEIINNKTYRNLFILAVIGTLILTFSFPVGLAKTGMINDKFAHASAFFVLAFLYSHSQGSQFVYKAILSLAAFGFMIELIQYFLPWRSFSWFDWLADIVGIISYDFIHRLKRTWLKR